ncbi:hypothetical protein T4B_3782 [Trichinella pseudospiralis]|uniref:Uncharacterized protein n=1 Tax=Trichinella pseudospiralis TaxID=6337 RepID=A0A0V1JCF4_TRIPS|nr:hypothetical protein T4B_3782 [Trichinella pseudospiralis]
MIVIQTVLSCLKWKKYNFKRSGRFSQIYTEEASNVSAYLETSGQFTTYKIVKSTMYRRQGRSFLPLPATHQQLEIPLHWRVTMPGSKFLFSERTTLTKLATLTVVAL